MYMSTQKLEEIASLV